MANTTIKLPFAVIAVLLLTITNSSWADDDPTPQMSVNARISDPGPLTYLEAGKQDGSSGIMNGRPRSRIGWLVAQHPGVQDPVAAAADPEAQDLSYHSRELINTVTSLWSLTFQSNNFRLENGEWVYNLLFQPVLPISLTKDVSLITRPACFLCTIAYPSPWLLVSSIEPQDSAI